MNAHCHDSAHGKTYEHLETSPYSQLASLTSYNSETKRCATNGTQRLENCLQAEGATKSATWSRWKETVARLRPHTHEIPSERSSKAGLHRL